jgi:hypothetical protein
MSLGAGPLLVADPEARPGTGLILFPRDGALPAALIAGVMWAQPRSS